MSRIPRQAKRDANEQPICEALTKAGCAVLKVSSAGAPDLVVLKGARVWLMEVKAKDGRLTPAQVRFRKTWTGPQPLTVRSVEQALHVLHGGPPPVPAEEE